MSPKEHPFLVCSLVVSVILFIATVVCIIVGATLRNNLTNTASDYVFEKILPPVIVFLLLSLIVCVVLVVRYRRSKGGGEEEDAREVDVEAVAPDAIEG